MRIAIPLGETLTLWDVAPRTEMDTLRAVTGATQDMDLSQLPGLLQRARELSVEPKILQNQLPGCR